MMSDINGHSKIKVLQFICPTGFYGAERWIIALAKGLDADIRCDLAVTIEPGMERLKIVDGYEAIGRDVHQVMMKHRFDLSVVPRLKNLLRDGGYNLIHTHGYKSDILGLTAGRLAGVACVATPHGFENAEDWKLRAYINLGNKFFKKFDIVAPLSEELCRDVEGFGVDKSKIRYIKNGVDLDEVEAKIASRDANPVLQNKTKKRVGFIGQMISRKNVFDLLDVFDQVAQQRDDLELIMLGDGEQREELQQYAATLASSSAIEFLGFRDDRLDWLQSFDLFAMTSTLEGIPRCLMESMAMGIPVAAYNIPGIDQLLVHENSGLLAEPGDKATLVKHWQALLFDEPLAARISANARAFVVNEFSGRRMAHDYTQLFNELMN
ncbi:MAG: glycosyltransferase family 4 protein [Cellvibrionaceae bacterium]|nr:glycosyltransferase family 4 protein [Cellvibrionaceae bacterium]